MQKLRVILLVLCCEIDFWFLSSSTTETGISSQTQNPARINSISSLLLPRFPHPALDRIGALLNLFPGESRNAFAALDRLWPTSWIGKGLSGEQKERLGGLVKDTLGAGAVIKPGGASIASQYLMKGVTFAGREGARVQFVDVKDDSKVVIVPCAMGECFFLGLVFLFDR